MSNTPITVDELLKRGIDDRLQDLLASAIGFALPASCRDIFTRDEMAALGYGKPCECGERGLALNEQECAECLNV